MDTSEGPVEQERRRGVKEPRHTSRQQHRHNRRERSREKRDGRRRDRSRERSWEHYEADRRSGAERDSYQSARPPRSWADELVKVAEPPKGWEGNAAASRGKEYAWEQPRRYRDREVVARAKERAEEVMASERQREMRRHGDVV